MTLSKLNSDTSDIYPVLEWEEEVLRCMFPAKLLDLLGSLSGLCEVVVVVSANSKDGLEAVTE